MLFFLFSICYLVTTPSLSVPLDRVLVDLTYTLNETSRKFPDPILKDLEIKLLVNGTDENGVWLQVEEFSTSTHVGTHMDAPSHFAQGGRNIDDLTLDQLIGPAAIIDISDKAQLDPDVGLVIDDILHWEQATGHSVDGTILFMRSGWGRRYWNQSDYCFLQPNGELQFPGMEEETARWLIQNRRIKGYGVDTCSIDKGTNSVLFPVHQILLRNGLYGIENVANLEAVPSFGAKVYVMPIKIEDGSGAPARVFASFPKFYSYHDTFMFI